MALPSSMGFKLTPAEVTTIETAFDTIIGVFNGHAEINLSIEERKKARAVAERRAPFLEKTFTVLGPTYPVLHPSFLNFATDNTNYEYTKQIAALLIRAATMIEIMEDHKYSADNLIYNWMLKFYNNAQSAEDSSVPGVDNVIKEISPLFEQKNEAGDTPEPAPED